MERAISNRVQVLSQTLRPTKPAAMAPTTLNRDHGCLPPALGAAHTVYVCSLACANVKLGGTVPTATLIVVAISTPSACSTLKAMCWTAIAPRVSTILLGPTARFALLAFSAMRLMAAHASHAFATAMVVPTAATPQQGCAIVNTTQRVTTAPNVSAATSSATPPTVGLAIPAAGRWRGTPPCWRGARAKGSRSSRAASASVLP